MAFEHGKYLGGIRTLEHLKDRCYVDPDTACWHWKGALSDGYPHVWMTCPETGKQGSRSGTRAALLLSGRPIPKGHIAYRRCDHLDCVNPAHISTGTKKEWGKWVQKTGKQKGNLQRTAANTANARRTRAKLSVEIVREIRSSNESGVALAARLGVCSQTISRVRTGRAWVDQVATNASVFSWRPAA